MLRLRLLLQLEGGDVNHRVGVHSGPGGGPGGSLGRAGVVRGHILDLQVWCGSEETPFLKSSQWPAEVGLFYQTNLNYYLLLLSVSNSNFLFSV